MFRESQAMRELHEIREQIYEETKNMPSADNIKYLNEQGKKASAYINRRDRSNDWRDCTLRPHRIFTTTWTYHNGPLHVLQIPR